MGLWGFGDEKTQYGKLEIQIRLDLGNWEEYSVVNILGKVEKGKNIPNLGNS